MDFVLYPHFTGIEIDGVEMDMYNPFQVQATLKFSTMNSTINGPILITSANYLK